MVTQSDEGHMAKRQSGGFGGSIGSLSLALPSGWRQSGQRVSVIRVTVAMVQLNVAVTDDKGNYITGLKPSDFGVSPRKTYLPKIGHLRRR